MKNRHFALPGAVSAVLLLSPMIGMAADEAKKPEAAPAQRPLKLGGPGIQQERSFAKIASGKWTGPKLADGQPDEQGHWSNTIANHDNFTDPQGGIP
ncbi:MAG: hypothetical protein LUQ11_14285, partial [Methylococcaceae bacterium]|nr:hypothetical protein [Methylococcaceae bacterium]